MPNAPTLSSMLKGDTEQNEPTYRMSMLPFGTYANKDGSESLGLAMPGMLHEPLSALLRLGQNSRFEDGSLGIPNPQNPENQQDALTGLLSVYGGNAVNPAAAIPKGALGMFAGRTAKTADHAALARAEELAASGAPREQIWNDTGWFKGPDDQWRFEINDSNTTWKLPRTLEPGQSVTGPTSKALSHPGLMEAYPEIADLPMQYVRVANPPPGSPFGSYHPGRGVAIRESGEFADPKSTTLHELQHHIQEQEGFALGTNTKAYQAEPRSDLSPKNYSTPQEWYRAHAGEVEARNVQARRNLNPIQRQMTPPWRTQDTPDGDQIVKLRSDDKQSSASLSNLLRLLTY